MVALSKHLLHHGACKATLRQNLKVVSKYTLIPIFTDCLSHVTKS